MTDQATDSRVLELRGLVEAVDDIDHSLHAHLAKHPDPIVAHAATMLASASAGIRRAIIKAGERAERAAAKVERNAHDQDVRIYDELTLTLARQRGITPAEMQKIRDDAGAEARRVAGLGSIEDQLKEVPSE